MKQKIRGLLLILTLLFCFTVPVSAATGNCKFRYGSVSIQTGKRKTLEIYNNGKKVNNRKVRWKSSNPKTAAVSNGNVTAKKSGSVKIYAVVSGKTISCNVYTYRQNVRTSFKGCSTSTFKIKKGSHVKLQPVKHGRITIYRSSDSRIASISSEGILTAKKTGTVTITCTSFGTDRYMASVKVVIQPEKKPVTVPDKPLSGSTGCIIHRGLSLEAPENSLPAFELAAQKGAQYIETDVRQLKDGTFVIFHDSSLLRMCGVNKKIEDLTWQEVKKYPIITGSNASLYENNMIPTLEQYLQCCDQYSVTPVIEIKSQMNNAGVARFNQIIRKSGKAPVVISFHEEPLKMLRQINRTISIQWILRGQITSAALDECYRYKFDVSAQYSYAGRAIIQKAHSRNIRVALWLVTDSGIADRYRKLGADYLTCDTIM